MSRPFNIFLRPLDTAHLSIFLQPPFFTAHYISTLFGFVCLFVYCNNEFGHWVCGESWLAIKDSLTHRPSSQGWASSVRLCYRLNVFVFLRQICMSKGEGGIFLYFFLGISHWLVCYAQ